MWLANLIPPVACDDAMILEICEKNFKKEIVESGKSAVTLFYMPRCPYCIEFMPKFHEFSEKSKMSVAQVDISSHDSDLWDDYYIEAVPTVIAFRQGKICARAEAILHKGLSLDSLKEEVTRRPECFHIS